MHDEEDQPVASGVPPNSAYGSAGSPPDPPVAYQPVPPTLAARRNGLAVWSLVLGAVWIFWVGSVLAVILGHVALAQIRDSNGWQRGRGLALAGLLLGYLALALFVISVVLASANG